MKSCKCRPKKGCNKNKGRGGEVARAGRRWARARVHRCGGRAHLLEELRVLPALCLVLAARKDSGERSERPDLALQALSRQVTRAHVRLWVLPEAVKCIVDVVEHGLAREFVRPDLHDRVHDPRAAHFLVMRPRLFVQQAAQALGGEDAVVPSVPIAEQFDLLL